MRERLTVVFVVVLISIAGTILAAERIVVEGVLVRVNDRIITISDFTERLRQELTQMPAQPNNEELRQFTDMLLEEMVNELILMERATEKRLTVDDQMVDQALDNLRKENNLEDDEAFEQALESSGMTEDALRERYRRSILLQRAVQGEVRPVEITEEELRQQYELDKENFSVPAKVELQQVFLSDSEASSAELERRARGIVERVRDGADLKAEATLAGSELQDLGAIPVADCRADLARALGPLDDGEVADPLTVPGGVQIVRLVQRIPAGHQSAETYEGQTRGLVEKLRQQYMVEVHREYLDIVFANLGGA
jgi:parvulin-like peptidyl-prolyl isomerase